MSITRKTTAVVLLVLALMTGAVSAASRALVLESFRQVENQDTEAHVSRAKEALSADFAALVNLAGDWSNWDDVYRFVEDGNQEFIDINVQGKVFEEMDVDAMVFLGKENEVVLAAAYSRKTGEKMPVPAGLLEALGSGPPLVGLRESDPPVSGVIDLPDGPVMIASRPVLTSEYIGPANGTLVMGKLLDQDAIRRLSETTHLSLSIFRVDASQPGSPQQVALSGLTTGERVVVQPISEETVAGYGIIDDILGRPAYLLEVTLPRAIYSQGAATVRYFLAALGLISVVTVLTIIVLLRQMVLRRLSRLSREVGAVGESHDFSLRVSPAGGDELGRLADTLNQTLDTLHRAQEKLRMSEARNRALVEAVPDALLTVNKDGVVVRAKPDREGRLTKLCETLLDSRGVDRVLPELAQKAAESTARALQTGQASSFEFTWDSEGAVREYEARVVMSAADEALAIIRDVSERKEVEEAHRKELLLREIHHRVKNNLQVISSLLSLQSDEVRDSASKEILLESQHRVKTMALIHEKLYGSRDMDGINFGEYLRDLVAYLASSYRLTNADTNVVVDAQDVNLDLEKAVPCGLIVNELVSNSLKYAFPGGRKGKIQVRLSLFQETGVQLAISDDGVGLPKGFRIESAESLGLRLVRSLADQLDASLKVNNGTGTSFELAFDR